MDIEEAVSGLTGTIGHHLQELAEDAGVSIDELMKAAEQQNIFECVGCGWWDEAEDFIDSEPFCSQCIEDHGAIV